MANDENLDLRHGRFSSFLSCCLQYHTFHFGVAFMEEERVSSRAFRKLYNCKNGLGGDFMPEQSRLHVMPLW